MPRPAKISDEERERVAQRHRNGESQYDLAKEYGVSQAAISQWISKAEKKSIEVEVEKKSTQSSKPSKPRGPPAYFKDLEKLVQTQTKELSQLKEKVAMLEGRIVPLRRRSQSPAPRRKQVIEALSNGETLTYEEIAKRIGTTSTRVRTCVSKCPEGLFQKFRGFERRGSRKSEVVRIRLA